MMTKIAHYEVYVDSGAGWQLMERFVPEQRSEAYHLAKEQETASHKVKIIKETFDVADNTYLETIEYVSNLSGKKGTKKSLSKIDYQKDSTEVVQDIADSRRNIYKAVIKFIALILISLIFANIFVSLVFPLLEIVAGEDNSSLMFFVFFVVFLAMAIPLVLKNIPWYIFIAQADKDKEKIPEEKFYEKAQNLVKAYNINSDLSNLKTNVYPEAPLEYKQYLIYFLSEILSNLNVRSALQNQFSRLGVKLLVFGGCLELGRYGGLKMSEANSILFEAFKITDGDKADLEEFYEAKQTFSDNKVAIYLTGIGAYLMHQVITDQKLYGNILNQAFDKWEAQRGLEITAKKESAPKEVEVEKTLEPAEKPLKARVNIKSDLKFLDASIPNQEEFANSTSASIRAIIANLSEKFEGKNIIEAGGVTALDFDKVRNGAKFAVEYLKDIGTYIEENNDERIILRNCCAIIKAEEDVEPNLNQKYVLDIFEHIYNNEIIVDKDIEKVLEAEGSELDFLGDKLLKETGKSIELYKLKY
ncbi:MAG: hypothetical protein PUH03_04245 [bacterium]|nr:hypothetical protein [bacterium]MDY2830168.1 hypothetical protein [Alphaproteobacteria bacterium]